ncbi:MAG: DUF2089 domain-containing protein [Chloroflexota bacterium]
MANIPQKCPSCAAPLAVTQLTCTSCGTGVVGRFDLSPFFRLSPASLQFLETFIKNRGNVKEIERETGESYWAIRRQLDEVIAEMGFHVQAETPPANQRQEILERLGRGEINAQEAAQQLTQLGKK